MVIIDPNDEVVAETSVSRMLVKRIPLRALNGTAYFGGAFISVSTLAAAWFAFGPIARLLEVNRSTTNTAVFALAAGAATALLLTGLAISSACSSKGSYKSNLNMARATCGTGGTVAGIGAVSALVAIFPHIALPWLAAAVVAPTVVGAGFGDLKTKGSLRKLCKNGHSGRCCDRICMKCGFLFQPASKWDGIVEPNSAKSKSGDRLDWYDVVSILHYRDLNYVEAVSIFETHFSRWDVKTIPVGGTTTTVGREEFFAWLEQNEGTLSQSWGIKPSAQLWCFAERAVRSDCEKNKIIRIEDIEELR